MFEHLRFIIARNITIAYFIILLIYGFLFIPIQHRDYINELDVNIEQDAKNIIIQLDGSLDRTPNVLSERDDFRTRIFDSEKNIIFDGNLFEGHDISLGEGVWIIKHQNDHFRILSFPIFDRDNSIIGYIQIGEIYIALIDDIREKFIILFLENILLSFFIYFLALFLADNALKPAIAMHKRLDQFAHDASHELKTPLSTAVSALDLALRQNAHIHIKEAKKALLCTSSIIDKLLELAKLTNLTIQPEKINLSIVLKEVITSFEPFAHREKIKIQSDIKDHVTIHADGIYTRLFIDNIIGNAIKFSDKGGEISVHLTGDTLKIRDRGIGIAKKDINSLFDPFFQADGSRVTKGSGLGLSIVKKVCDAHGWKISVESIESVGTAFTIRFKT